MSNPRFKEINKSDIYISVSEIGSWCDNFSHNFASLRKSLSVLENDQEILNSPEAKEKITEITEMFKVLNEKKNYLSVQSGKIKANIEMAGKSIDFETSSVAREKNEEIMKKWREVKAFGII